ncbi:MULTISPECIES: glycosyltransferase family A protein [unclassified Arthrobacter]|uniref:glycosyltransferase family 2 protein n=1 Tax=unclassified Arthrobacter TaxID=235627 RepID=UPI001C84D628|nr:glycosyltransferase family A protein [Arthrobacter sp. MAHUQ-56]MBX7445437.1 glycosyltransferase family 2 protein [Arthrobacter sp. MAHUQ-56]
MTPKVSVVIPAYNNEQYIAETLESVLNQSYEDYEVVIADHSSVDSTMEVIESFRGHPRLRILSPTPVGGGAKANWNRVSSEARGTLIKLVCGDDLIAPTALEEQVAAFEEHPTAVLVASQRDLVDASGRIFTRRRGLQGISGLVPGAKAVRATVVAGSNIFGEPACVMFRKDLLEAEGGWDDENPYLIDEATYARICFHGDVVALRRSLATFRISGSQWSVRLAQQQSRQAIAFHKEVARKHPGLLTALDLAVGNLKAIGMSYARRLAYMRLRKRMGHELVVESTV